jgi:hypothetical protein
MVLNIKEDPKMKLYLLLLAALLVGCVTTELEQTAERVKYFKAPNELLVACKEVAELEGEPASIWGGKVGNRDARNDLRNQASAMGYDALLEVDSDWALGHVRAKAYKCSGMAAQ